MDEHADTRIPETIISYEETQDLQNIFDYTNFSVNVNFSVGIKYANKQLKVIKK